MKIIALSILMIFYKTTFTQLYTTVRPLCHFLYIYIELVNEQPIRKYLTLNYSLKAKCCSVGVFLATKMKNKMSLNLQNNWIYDNFSTTKKISKWKCLHVFPLINLMHFFNSVIICVLYSSQFYTWVTQKLVKITRQPGSVLYRCGCLVWMERTPND